MKIFVISDIHGSLSSFQKAMDAYCREGAELLVICGDYLNHGPRNDIPAGYDTKGLASALNGVKHIVTGVRGNCDSEVDQMMLEFPVLAPYTNIVVPGGASGSIGERGAEAGCGTAACGVADGNGAKAFGSETCVSGGFRRIFVHHGHLMTAQEAARLNPPGTVIVSGHTHVPVLERFSIDAKTPSSAADCAATPQTSGASCVPSASCAAEYIALNPGSISIPKGGSEPGYAVIAVAAASMEIKLCTLDGRTLKTLSC